MVKKSKSLFSPWPPTYSEEEKTYQGKKYSYYGNHFLKGQAFSNWAGHGQKWGEEGGWFQLW